MDLSAFRAAIGDIPQQDHPRIVQQKSRDFYWYSPVLKRQLDHVTAELVVSELVTNVVRHAHAARCWLTMVTGATVEIDVIDDGVGFGGQVSDGVGLGGTSACSQYWGP